MSLPAGPLVAWYGDDFTGSAAVMEVLTFAGFPSVLFFDIPTEAQLARFGDLRGGDLRGGDLRGIGIAGEARSKPTAWMDEHLPPIFAALKQTGAPIVHYKVCSTFDSSAKIGSIGRAADLALAAHDWSPAWAPLVVAAPAIGRWQAFGNLFATAGAAVHRLDRHPTMAVHPVTPMNEADVRRHLAAQTERPVGLVDLRTLATGKVEAVLSDADDILAFDVVDEATLAAVGETVWRHAKKMFAIGSQGLEYALVAHWRQAGLSPHIPDPPRPRAVKRMAAVSGSCSPITAEQIARAEADGFAALPLDASAAAHAEVWQKEEARAVEAGLAALSEGRDPLIYSARGPDDPAVAALRNAANGQLDAAQERLGEGLGRILMTLVREAKLTRAAIAGGDTSSSAARGLKLYAVTAESALAPGAALLKGHGDEPATDGLELALKGGQMGPPDYFQQLRAGGPGGSQ